MKTLAGIFLLVAISLAGPVTQGQQPVVVPYRMHAIQLHVRQLLPEGIEIREPAPPEILSSNAFYGIPHYLPAANLEPHIFEQTSRNDWVAWILFLSLGALALAQFLFSARMQQYFKASWGMRFFNQMERDGSFFNEALTYLLLFNYLSAMALLIIYTVSFLTGKSMILPHWHPALFFLLIFGLLILFYVIKGVVTSFIAWIFKTQNANSIYLKNVYLLNQITGIMVLPLVAYSIFNSTPGGLIVAWALIVLAGIVKVSRNMIIGHKQAGFSPYYIILYLCAVELAPLLIMIKAASGYLPQG
ncbi:MAG: DUF4271 domain-containing protein [Bacteroidales bacterium]